MDFKYKDDANYVHCNWHMLNLRGYTKALTIVTCKSSFCQIVLHVEAYINLALFELDNKS